jgi:NADH-quinone oxidoreductase subunit H
MQDRVGPNRVGPFGIWQPLADAVKSFLKEDFMPAHVRAAYFWLAPAIVMIPGIVVMAVIPFGSNLGAQKMVIADLDVGVLFTFGIASLGVYGLALAGYAANSKYPLLGGIRASAQLISYEIAMGLSVIPVFLFSGCLNLSGVVAAQSGTVAGVLPNWMVFQSPMTCLAFFVFMIAAFAETNRLPFDMPEAEQELAGGYNIEYSSIKFALFFMGEYANMIAASALMVVLFFGGWSLPYFGMDQAAGAGEWGKGLAHIFIFLAKVGVFLLFFVWVRWMLPRFRYDQLMDLGWKRFVPISLANLAVTAVWLWFKAGMLK